MTINHCAAFIANIRTEHQLVDALAYLSTMADRRGEAVTSFWYADMAWYVNTGRLSGSTCRRIREDVRNVCKHANRQRSHTTENVGAYLHTFDT